MLDLEDIMDSRDILERLAELEESDSLTDEEGDELAALRNVDRQGQEIEDWEYGVTLVADHAFTEYAADLAIDLGLVPDSLTWPLTCVDWEQAASELKMDYTAIVIEEVTYWVR